MTEESEKRNKRSSIEEEPQSKRSKNTLLTIKKISRESQLELLDRIKSKNPPPNNHIKVSKEWYAQWEGYCLMLHSKLPPPLCLSQTDDPNEYILLHFSAVMNLGKW
jgi:hypothetical protein